VSDEPRCIPGRLVTLALRNRRTRKVTTHTVVYPWQWTKGNVLASVRRAHPGSTVRITEWLRYSDDASCEPRVWIVNPRKILDYDRIGAGPHPGHTPLLMERTDEKDSNTVCA
jgi:hypothetical protein